MKHAPLHLLNLQLTFNLLHIDLGAGRGSDSVLGEVPVRWAGGGHQQGMGTSPLWGSTGGLASPKSQAWEGKEDETESMKEGSTISRKTLVPGVGTTPWPLPGVSFPMVLHG